MNYPNSMESRMNRDMMIKRDTISELDFEPGVDSACVDVKVDEGIVTLSGLVPHYYQKNKAEEAVWRVPGVQGIVQGIRVRSLGVIEIGDEDLARRAAEHIQWNALVPDNSVQPRVRNGWVILDGSVEWQFQREAAANDISVLQGVRGVLNQIKLNPTASPEGVKSRIEQALQRHADVKSAKIKVNSNNGKVILDGHIDSLFERAAVNNAAWSAPGVLEVVDRLLS